MNRRAVIAASGAWLGATALQTLSSAAAQRPAKLTVYHVRDQVETVVALTPAAMMKFPSVRRWVRHSPPAIAAALAAIYAASPAPRSESTDDVDARWGLVFAYPNGREFSVFCDSFASAAIVDGAPRTFRKHTLAAWLAAHYGPA